MRHGTMTIVVAVLAISGSAVVAQAATLVLTNGETVSGWIVSQSDSEVRIEVETDDGVDEQSFAKSEVADILQPVSGTRLAELSPDSPNDYRLYAEELAAKRKDPEAREAATRLFLIAAHLQPTELGRSCLLGMAGLAKEPGTARRYRLMAYLLDATHDERLLQGPADLPAAGDDEELREDMLQALRWLRVGRRREAQRLIDRRPEVLAKLEQATGPMHVRRALSAICLDCKEGYIPCPVCDGKKKLPDGSSCERCRVRGVSWGRLKCETCQGRFRDPAMTDKQLLALVEAEYQLTTGKSKAPSRAWSAKAWKQPSAGNLNLLSVSRYDPRKSVYRDGKWTAP